MKDSIEKSEISAMAYLLHYTGDNKTVCANHVLMKTTREDLNDEDHEDEICQRSAGSGSDSDYVSGQHCSYFCSRPVQQS